MIIKRYKINYENWKCIIKKKFVQKRMDDQEFSGYIGMLFIEEVSQEQSWIVKEEKITICDKGYVWLVFVPDNKNCCITAMMTPERKIILWYIDIIENLGLGRDCILEYDDLFLDYIVTPDGFVFEEDRDELTEAYKEKVITHEQFALIKSVVESLKREGYFENGRLLRLTKHIYNKMAKKEINKKDMEET